MGRFSRRQPYNGHGPVREAMRLLGGGMGVFLNPEHIDNHLPKQFAGSAIVVKRRLRGPKLIYHVFTMRDKPGRVYLAFVAGSADLREGRSGGFKMAMQAPNRLTLKEGRYENGGLSFRSLNPDSLDYMTGLWAHDQILGRYQNSLNPRTRLAGSIARCRGSIKGFYDARFPPAEV